ncbi:MAG: SDR family oxidoreductase [Micrococcales bacterium]|nr:SDR family oxidoreductase [Micrococcales bacterium]NBR61319.1 SDR family oxidoreductase [Actinomycetota bacterium]NBR55046.1 SDR family oxidoreductase [Micrococcales bacterium]NBT47437.1 SDR family oxidoreductase [Actinomycetota bacterium]NBY43372.1 SDR family oxidoreductase [Micrococcales bacterium]
MEDFSGKTALVTGASSGLGEAYALALADRGARVILVARRADRLRALSDRINAKHGIYASTVIPMDLSSRDAASTLAKVIKGRGTQVDILVNNAGFGSTLNFIEEDHSSIVNELSVNVNALVELTHFFLPGMVERRNGVVINIASTAAFQSLPYMAVYGATKAFVLSFTEALWGETRKQGVRVVAVCPGPTQTEFFDAGGSSPALGKFIRSTEDVMETTFLALAKRNGRAVAIDGLLNKLTAASSRFFTRKFAVKLAAFVMNPNKKS